MHMQQARTHTTAGLSFSERSIEILPRKVRHSRHTTGFQNATAADNKGHPNAHRTFNTMSNETEFVYRPPSPWSIKAGWALKCAGIPHKRTLYTGTPLFIPLTLRWRLGNWWGRVTAPILFPNDGSGAMTDTSPIVEWADKTAFNTSNTHPLIPEGQLEEVKRWNDLSDAILFYFRTVFRTGIVHATPEQASELSKAFFKSDNAIARYMLQVESRSMLNKYKAESDSSNQDKAKASLVSLQQALAGSSNGYILPSGFSFADITMAVALHALQPYNGEDGPPGFGPAAVSIMAPVQDMLAEFADVFKWRDGIIEEHFKATAKI
eukprot:jgi/Chrzof1/11402/Cz05g35120.t1